MFLFFKWIRIHQQLPILFAWFLLLGSPYFGLWVKAGPTIIYGLQFNTDDGMTEYITFQEKGIPRWGSKVLTKCLNISIDV